VYIKYFIYTLNKIFDNIISCLKEQTFDKFCRTENFMEVTVDRTITPEGDLVFVMRLKNPHIQQVGNDEVNMMSILNAAQSAIEEIPALDLDFKDRVQDAVTKAKKIAFENIFFSLKFWIKAAIENPHDRIYQEIENWVCDAQPEPLKSWLNEFYANRTKYYFNNDIQSQKQEAQDPEEDIEIDEEDE